MILICYDGSTDAREAIARGAPLLRGQRATVLTVWSPFDAAALGLSGGVEDMRKSDEVSRRHALLLGSVSQAVIQRADRMVIVVPSPAVAAARARKRQAEG